MCADVFSTRGIYRKPSTWNSNITFLHQHVVAVFLLSIQPQLMKFQSERKRRLWNEWLKFQIPALPLFRYLGRARTLVSLQISFSFFECRFEGARGFRSVRILNNYYERRASTLCLTLISSADISGSVLKNLDGWWGRKSCAGELRSRMLHAEGVLVAASTRFSLGQSGAFKALARWRMASGLLVTNSTQSWVVRNSTGTLGVLLCVGWVEDIGRAPEEIS